MNMCQDLLTQGSNAEKWIFYPIQFIYNKNKTFIIYDTKG